MRRCKDNWVNATQILKLCDFPKAKRTKILEKGVQKGLHEKVQGGYGRFQGTWIPLPEAQKLAQEYNITAEIAPVLYVDVTDPTIVILRKGKGIGAAKENTPLKRKYNRKPTSSDATPKKVKYEEHMPVLAVFTQNYAHAMPRAGSSIPQMGSMHAGPRGMGPPQLDYADLMGSQKNLYLSSGVFPNYAIQEPNFVPPAPVPPQGPFGRGNFTHGLDDSSRQQMMYSTRPGGTLSHLTNETNWSQEEHMRDSDTSVSLGEHKQGAALMDQDNSHVAQLLRFFSGDNMPIPYFLYNPPPEFNVNEPIDDEGHSTLHWAASIGNLNLVHLLLSKGANPLVVSNYGLNLLSKCISFNNCFDAKSFPHVVAALETCLINTDVNGRTPLHYLCQFSKVAHKLPALSYYMGEIFSKLTAMAHHSGSGVDLVQNVINHQDINGETCLHLAVRAGCVQFVKFLLGHGARDDLADLHHLTAKALIMQLGLAVYNFDGDMAHAQAQHARMYEAPMPTFQVTRAGLPGSRGSRDNTYEQGPEHPALGTPIRGFSRLAETPDTQRTTVQEEDIDELHDRVTKDDLRSLLEQQAGTVEDNKENIFADGQVLTPKQASVPPGPKVAVLGVISERPGALPEAVHSPNPPPLDSSGRIASTGVPRDAGAPLPMPDVSAMVAGMMHSLLASYDDQLGGLKYEQLRVHKELAEKRLQNTECARKTTALLSRNGFAAGASLDTALGVVAGEADICSAQLDQKEAQLQATLGKWHAYELAEVVERHERDMEQNSERHSRPASALDAQEKWVLSKRLGLAQVRRKQLASLVVARVRDFAVSPRMNKYRRLISLSCGLKVEDIDGLIEGIEESLTESVPA
uniref:Transcriptional factor swi4 n=1 Tax=Metschnikowia australis TaxID=27321 RepID=A0A6C0MB56_9ASCO|nr:transcriptional factor swi4 [Metschnikowia australis]